MKINLFDGMAEINIPDGFTYNENCSRYPYRDKPAVIMTNKENQVDITFNRLDKILTPENIKAAIKAVILLLEEREDIASISVPHFFQGENVRGCWICYMNRGVYGDMFNCLAVFPIRNRFSMGTLSTGFESKKEGKRVFLDIIKSVKDKTRGIY